MESRGRRVPMSKAYGGLDHKAGSEGEKGMSRFRLHCRRREAL